MVIALAKGSADVQFAFLALGTSGVIVSAHLAPLALTFSGQKTETFAQHRHAVVLALSALYGVTVGFTWIADATW